MSCSMFENASIIEAGVDWLAVTAKEGEAWHGIQQVGTQVLDGMVDCGYIVKAASMLGYTGYGTGNMFVGTRADSVYLRSSGYIAHRLVSLIPADGIKVTRIDLQVTVVLPNASEGSIHELMELVRDERTRKGDNPKRHPKLVDNGANGSTLYVGSQNATTYSRLYDKSREGKGTYPSGSYRLETETKREGGTALYRLIRSHQFDAQEIASVVLRWFGSHDVDTGIPVEGTAIMPPDQRTPSDVERKLKWLRDTVSPTVRSLCALGYASEVAEALYYWQMPEEERQSVVE